MKVYIAGPMRGYPRWNFDAFDAAFERWRAAGHTTYSPANVDRALGIDPDGPLEQVTPDFASRAMEIDLAIIRSVDAIALLSGWKNSTGSTVEVAMGKYLGLKFYDAETMKELLDIPSHPWSVYASHVSKL